MKFRPLLRSKAHYYTYFFLILLCLTSTVGLLLVVLKQDRNEHLVEPIIYGQSFGDDGDHELYGMGAANWSILHAPTPPPRKPQLFAPWEKQRMVIISVSLANMSRNPEVLDSYVEFLELVLPIKRVLAVFHRKDRRFIPQFMEVLENNTVLNPLLDRLEFLPAESDSKWIRDFGPLFGFNGSGQFLVVDCAFMDPRTQVSNHLVMESISIPEQREEVRTNNNKDLESIRGCDITPAIIAGHLQASEEIPTLLTRPPLILSGGDLILVDSRTALVSRSTLEANGGRTDYFEEVLHRYMGIEKVVYLQPLPGETIEHLDFIIQICGPDAILIATPEEFDDLGRINNKLLKRDIINVLNKNKKILQTHFPEHKLIEVPMPPPIFESNDQVRLSLLEEVILRIGNQLRLAPTETLAANSPKASTWKVADKVMNRIFMDTGVMNMNSNESIDKIVTFYNQRSFQELNKIYSGAYTYYRTFLNSLQIIGDDNQEYIIIPHYTGVTPEEDRTLNEMEKRVAQAYMQASPNAKLLWMDCSYLITHLGAVHCMAITMPEPRI